MRSGALSVSLLTLVLTGAALGARVALMPLADVTPRLGIAVPPRDSTPHASPKFDSLAQAIVPRDPFRVTHQPASVAYDPIRAAQPPAPTLPKPALILTGLVWDSHGNPSAVLDGLPGGGPRVVQQGDLVGALRVRRIARDRVIVTGMDTSWTLTVREPWK